MDHNRIDFPLDESKTRCKTLRKRILHISQRVGALHIGGAFSCIEMVELIYFHLMTHAKEEYSDSFIMSKGHGCMAQYVALEALGILTSEDLALYCRSGGRLGCHPDYGNPGIEASTGSLGHGLNLAVGMAYADQIKKDSRTIFLILSDGELQEGSVWEGILLAPSLRIRNLVAFLDLNDFQAFGRTSSLLPNFYPVVEKIRSFGWWVAEVDGHDSEEMLRAVLSRDKEMPCFIVGRTTKGKGVSFMEDQPIWHYRSPSKDEYERACAEIEQA